MKNKKNIILLILILVVITLGVWFYVAMQGDSDKKEVANLKILLNQKGKTSLNLIDDDLSSGKITPEQSLIYKVYAVYGDDALPEEYKSEKPFFEGTEVMRLVKNNIDKLSQETQDILIPFTLRPDDPNSYFNQKYSSEIEKVSSNNIFIPTVQALKPNENIYTKFVVSADNKVKIWYPNVDTTSRNVFGAGNIKVTSVSAKKIAENIKNALDNDYIIDTFEKLLEKKLLSDGTSGGDDKLDIYVAPIGKNLGLTYAVNATPSPSYILIDSSIAVKDVSTVKATTAHEIFHAFQYVFDYNDNGNEWWAEATATWSEDLIYPSMGSEFAYLNDFINYPEVSLFERNNPDAHDYGAYIFAYYLTQNFGDDFIKQSWLECEKGPCLDGVEALLKGKLKEEWAKFTLWNYNLKPVKFYNDFNFPEVSSVDSKKTEKVTVEDYNTAINIDKLEPLSADLSMVINNIDKKGKDVKKLTFKDLDNFTKGKNNSIKAVIYYKNKNAEIEDWTGKKARSFCIDSKEEDFEKIILIFSNADKSKNFNGSFINVEAGANCFKIDQTDNVEAVLHIPYTDADVRKIVDINTKIETISEGEPVEKAEAGQQFAYLTKWSLYNEFEQVRDGYQMDCFEKKVSFDAGWTSRSVGIMTFDLKSLKNNDTFGIDLSYGYPHPKGSYEETSNIAIGCVHSISIGAQNINIPIMEFKNIYQGRIFDMDENGAKIEIKNSCTYDSCTSAGMEMQTMKKPVILEIRKFAK